MAVPPAGLDDADLAAAVEGAQARLAAAVDVLGAGVASPDHVRAAVQAVAAARSVLRPLAAEWVLRAAARAWGWRLSQVEVSWNPADWPAASIDAVVDSAGPHTGVDDVDEDVVRALLALSDSWPADGPGHLVLRRES